MDSHSLKFGDHLVVQMGFYTHHGIYVGNHPDFDDAVVHWSSGLPSFENVSGTDKTGETSLHKQGLDILSYIRNIKRIKDLADIRTSNLHGFHEGKMWWIQNYAPGECDLPEVVLARASRSRDHYLKENGKYHFLSNNCEHFARWCKTGKRLSPQSESLHRAIRGVEVQVKPALPPIVEALRGGVSRSMAKEVLLPVALMLVADGVQLAVEHGSAYFGFDPRDAKRAGQAVGLLSHLGIGLRFGGLFGVAMGGVTWALKEFLDFE